MGGTTKLCRAALTQAHMPNRRSEDSQAFGSSSTHLNMAAEDNRMQALRMILDTSGDLLIVQLHRNRSLWQDKHDH